MQRQKSWVIDIHKKAKWKTQNYQIWLSNCTKKIAFLDAVLYKDENKIIQTTLHRKPTDQQAFLKAVVTTCYIKICMIQFLKHGSHQ